MDELINNLWPVTSLISVTVTFISFFWVVRHYKRYQWYVFAASGLFFLVSAYFYWDCLLRPHTPEPISKILMHLCFVVMSTVIVRCGFTCAYNKSIACDLQPFCTPEVREHAKQEKNRILGLSE